MMSIPSWLESQIFSCDDVIKGFNVESVLNSNPFVSTEPLQDPPTYNPHHATIRNFVDNCDSGTLAASPAHSNPVLMATFFNTSRPNDGQSQNTLPGAILADKIKHKMIEKQRRKDMKALLSTLKSLMPDENPRGKRSVSDQMQEAVNYVHHLRQKVEDLQNEREKLKANSDKNARVSFQGLRLSCNEKFCLETPATGGYAREFPNVKIKTVDSAVQVWTNTFENQIVYSDLLLAMEDSGLEVVCAASFTINNTVYHTIHGKGISYTKVTTLFIFVLFGASYPNERFWEHKEFKEEQPALFDPITIGQRFRCLILIFSTKTPSIKDFGT